MPIHPYQSNVIIIIGALQNADENKNILLPVWIGDSLASIVFIFFFPLSLARRSTMLKKFRLKMGISFCTVGIVILVNFLLCFRVLIHWFMVFGLIDDIVSGGGDSR